MHNVSIIIVAVIVRTCSKGCKMNPRMAVVLVFLLLANSIYSQEECGDVPINGSLTFPWNVGIYLEQNNVLELTCFGSFIQPNAVLTAAHCFCDNLDASLRTATFYIAIDQDNFVKKIKLPTSSPVFQIDKRNIHIHKYYKGFASSFSYDLATIKQDFKMKINPVCLDWSGDIKEKNNVVKQPIWQNNKAVIVDQSNLTVEDCYEGPNIFTVLISEDKSCTKLKNLGNRISHESEGGGLVFYHSNKWYIKGVIGTNDVTSGKSTYTSIYQYANWISNIII